MSFEDKIGTPTSSPFSRRILDGLRISELSLHIPLEIIYDAICDVLSRFFDDFVVVSLCPTSSTTYSLRIAIDEDYLCDAITSTAHKFLVAHGKCS